MTHNQAYQSYYLRTGLVLYPSQQEAIEEILTKLLQQVPASFILLTDVTGQVVSSRGDQENTDMVALGSLVAGDLAASHEIARQTRQYQADQMVFREGQNINTFTCEAGYHLALLVQASTEVPMGWARMTIRKAVKTLVEITTEPPAEQAQSQPNSPEVALYQEDLPDLINEALDDLWLE
jgi:predicted regulator of Ras-like GTPase activity (Roadblock/LC7/MglB family)